MADPSPAATEDRIASRLRGFGPIGLLAMVGIFAGNLIVIPLSAILVLMWAQQSRTPWRKIGYVRPESWIRDLMWGIAFGAVFKMVMKAVVMPLLGADPINHTYHYLVGNTGALPAMVFVLVVGAGFGEETLFRGYMFERLRKLLGTGALAQGAIVSITAGLFGLAHYPEQGIAGVQQATIFGAIFAATGQIWKLMCAHAAFDLTALAIIYLDLEFEVAHLLFE